VIILQTSLALLSASKIESILNKFSLFASLELNKTQASVKSSDLARNELNLESVIM
jgi:hypothetical protein